jgi:hypothetical protein
MAKILTLLADQSEGFKELLVPISNLVKTAQSEEDVNNLKEILTMVRNLGNRNLQIAELYYQEK